MGLNYTEEEFKESKSEGFLSITCDRCGKEVKRKKVDIQATLYHMKHRKKINWYCSSDCQHHRKSGNTQPCLFCGKAVYRPACLLTRPRFCSISCATKWKHAHKTKGIRVSKLEKWIAEELVVLFPNLEFHFNRKDTILSELDIYIPSLKLAFELNGIFHYEPIYGDKKLKQIQTNDSRKILACAEKEISCCVIDSSSLSGFSPAKGKKYLDIIIKIINEKKAENTTH